MRSARPIRDGNRLKIVQVCPRSPACTGGFLADTSYVVAVSATNHPELLDRAVWRRFQLRLALPAPTPALAREWFCRFEQRLGAKLVPPPSTLAKRLRGLSFAELEQFGLDVQRHHVLSLPDGDVRAIVAARLRQWRKRVPPTGGGATAPADDDDA